MFSIMVISCYTVIDFQGPRDTGANTSCFLSAALHDAVERIDHKANSCICVHAFKLVMACIKFLQVTSNPNAISTNFKLDYFFKKEMHRFGNILLGIQGDIRQYEDKKTRNLHLIDQLRMRLNFKSALSMNADAYRFS